MAPAKTIRGKIYFSVEAANRTLPLVQKIVGDIVQQFRIVSELDARLSGVLEHDGKRRGEDAYSEELAQTRAELEAEAEKLNAYQEELQQLGVELKGPDGLCDFPAMKDGREVYLCWKLGEPSVQFWHEVRDGFAGRQPIGTFNAPPRPGARPK